MQAEIEKVKKRREERAIEKAQHEEEMVGSYIFYLKMSFLVTIYFEIVFLGDHVNKTFHHILRSYDLLYRQYWQGNVLELSSRTGRRKKKR